MKKMNLKADSRKEIGKKVSLLRKAGIIPAIVYGKGVDSVAVSIPEEEFARAIGTAAGSNVIITLSVDGQAFPVITHEFQRDALTDKMLHVDFLRIRMDEAIKTKVHVELHGTPLGVKNDGGILVQKLRELEIKCLPDSIPEKFELNVSELQIGGEFKVSDIKAEKGVEFVTPINDVVVSVSAPAKEEEVAPTPEALAMPGVEGEAPAAEGVVPGAAAPAEAEKPAKEAKKEPKK